MKRQQLISLPIEVQHCNQFMGKAMYTARLHQKPNIYCVLHIHSTELLLPKERLLFHW